MAMELTRARRVLVIAGEQAAAVVRACSPGSCDVVAVDPATAGATNPSTPEVGPARGAGSTATATRSHDVVLVDLAGEPLARHRLRLALAAVAETGLVVVAGVHPGRNRPDLRAALAGTLCDSYPEVEGLTRDERGTACWLLGRVLPRRQRDGGATPP
jgi:hypothetical protein